MDGVYREGRTTADTPGVFVDGLLSTVTHQPPHLGVRGLVYGRISALVRGAPAIHTSRHRRGRKARPPRDRGGGLSRGPAAPCFRGEAETAPRPPAPARRRS